MKRKLFLIECGNVLSSLNLRKEKGGKLRLGLTFCAVSGLLLYFSALYSYLLCDSFEKINALSILPLYLYFACFSYLFFVGILFTSGFLFQSKDYDLLSSLPIPYSHRIQGKVAFLYVNHLLMTLLILLPSFSVWQSYAKIPWGNFALLLSSMIFVPIIPLVLAHLLGIVVIYLGKFLPHKGVFQSFCTLFFVILFVYVSSKNASQDELLGFVEGTSQQILTLLPWSRCFQTIIMGEWGGFLLFIALSSLLLLAFFLFVSKYYQSLHFFLERSHQTTAKQKQVQVKEKKMFYRLLQKEFSTVFSISVYTVNTVLPSFIAFFGLLYFFFIGGDTLLILRVYPEGKKFLPLALATLFSFAPPTTSALSLEGSRLWILRALPIATEEILFSKLCLHYCINLPFCVLSSLGACYLLELDFVWSVIAVCFPLLSCSFFGFLGLFLNLKFPNFRWNSPAVVVKQGVPVLILVLLVFLSSGSFGYVIFKMTTMQAVARTYLCFSFLLLLGNFLCFDWIKKKSSRVWKGEVYEV